MIGQTLGQYKLEEELGAGAGGAVYRATDSKLGRSGCHQSPAGSTCRKARSGVLAASLVEVTIIPSRGREFLNIDTRQVGELDHSTAPGARQAVRSGARPTDVRDASSRSNQTFAMFQSRAAVCGEI
jgi:hypothetical protein